MVLLLEYNIFVLFPPLLGNVSKMEDCCFCGKYGKLDFSKELLSNTTYRFVTVEEGTGHPSSCKL